MAIKAIAHSYWRRIKDGARTFESVPASVKDDVRTLAQTDVQNQVITVEEYKGFIGEDYPTVEVVRTYSDANLMIRQDSTGNIYSEAIDPVGSGRTYTETDTPIEQTEDDRVAQLEEDSAALKIILGEEEETK